MVNGGRALESVWMSKTRTRTIFEARPTAPTWMMPQSRSYSRSRDRALDSEHYGEYRRRSERCFATVFDIVDIRTGGRAAVRRSAWRRGPGHPPGPSS